MDWTRLSPRSVAILQRVALPISTGLSATDVAQANDWTIQHVYALLKELRDEIRAQLQHDTGR